jgi:transcriptional regulator with XRE-family HTH domain
MIRRARLAEGLSQTEVGSLLVPSRSYAAVSDIERGVTALSVDVMLQLAKILNRSASEWVRALEVAA